MKVKQKLISLILSLTLAMGLATAPAFASSDPDTSYFVNNQAINWTGASGLHSLSNGTKLGDLVAKGINYLSLDLASLNSGLNQIYTNISSTNTNTSNIYNLLNVLSSGWYAADSSLNPPQGQNNSWYYRVLQALGDIKTINDNEYTGLAGHLGAISSKLDAWTGTDTLDIADIVYDIYKNNESNLDFFEDVLSGGAITSDWHWNDNGTWRAVGSGAIPVINRNSDGQLYLNVYPYESSDLSIKGLLQAMIRNQFYETTAIRGTYENNQFEDYTSSGAITNDTVDNVIKGISKLNNNSVNSSIDNLSKLSDIYNSLTDINLDTYVNYRRYNGNSTFNQYYRVYELPYIYSNGEKKSIINSRTLNFTPSVADYIMNINSNILQTFTSIYSLNRSYTSHNITDGAITVDIEAYSVMDMLESINYSVANGLSDLVYVLADPESIQAKKNNAAQTTAALDNFTGSGDASASAADFGIVKDSVNALKQTMAGGASPTQAFNILGGDSDGWSWFSQEVADSMDTTNSSRSLLRGYISSSTPYLDSYYDSIYSVLGIGGGIE